MRTKSIVLGLAFVATAAGGYLAGVSAAKPAGVMWAAPEIKWDPYDPTNAQNPLQVAKLWGDRAKGKDYGMLLKLPGGMPANWHAHTGDYHAINISGTWMHAFAGGEMKELPPGSYVFQPGKQEHGDACKAGADCIILVHQHAKGDYIPAKAAAAAPADKPAAPATK